MATEDDRRGSESDSAPDAETVNIYLEILFALGASLLIPWVYLTFERANFLEFDFEGLNRSRVLWLVPLFYGVAAVSTMLLFPTHIELFWLFPVLLLGQFIEIALHEASLGADPSWLAGVRLPLAERFTPFSVGAFLAIVVASTGAGWRLRQWDLARECRKILVDDQYVLPFESVDEVSERVRRSGVFGLERDRSIHVLGETGSGKTETMKVLVYQMLQLLRADADGTAIEKPVVVLDYKTDYREFLERHWDPAKLMYLTPDGASVSWNVFLELEHGATTDELARTLFPDPGPRANDGDRFFANASRQLLGAILTHLDREFRAEGERPTNADLVELVQSTDREEMHDLLSASKHVTLDLAAAQTALDPEAERQAAGVYANFQVVIADRFRGDFATAGDFSLTEYMREPEGRILVLDVPVMESESVQPTYQFFIDWAARCALADGERSRDGRHPRESALGAGAESDTGAPSTGAQFVLDEFARLPRLRKLGDLLNVGRGRDTQLLLGLQSVSQLYATYGHDRANALLSGLVQSVVMRVGDQESVDYARSQLGREAQQRTTPVHDRRGNAVGSREVHDEQYPLAESDLRRFEDGEALAIVPDGWIRGQLSRLRDVRGALAHALEKLR